ncbi:MAG TPA: hypothetical protein VFY29_00410 [Terriglobia bacterium]|nr:hypothetical protein [Terriglobia bacterium]
MKLAAQMSIVLIILAGASGYAVSPPEEILPGNDPRNVVEFYGLAFQAATVPSEPGYVQFHIVINGGRTDGKPIERSLRLTRVGDGSFPAVPTFKPYPDAPKVKSGRSGTIVTVDFTAPGKVANDANLALYFKACFTECDEFYARLAKFVFMPPAPVRPAFESGPTSGAWKKVFPPPGFCCSHATGFVFKPGDSTPDDLEEFAASRAPSLRVTTTALANSRVRFHIVIEGRQDTGAQAGRLEESVRLTWLVDAPGRSLVSDFEPYASGASKIATRRKNDIVTIEFTVPGELIDDPRLALSFSPGYLGSGIDDGGHFQFYAPLAALMSSGLSQPNPRIEGETR